MAHEVTIVTYHYVRDLSRSSSPGIKALESRLFVGQLDYMQRHYRFVTMADCIAATYEGRPLPRAAALLTFDDGYRDHFTDVFPVLSARGIQGCFFPVAKAVTERKVLDVNKIQFVLASARDVEPLLTRIFALLDQMREELDLETGESYFERLAKASRFDSREVRFVKHLLQWGLPRVARKRILNTLFAEYVTEDEEALANTLYMDEEQVRYLLQHGMCVGSHAHDHVHLDALSPDAQRQEIERSTAFLSSLGIPREVWTMCYPYGSYDESTIRILRETGFRLGLTTRVGIARIEIPNAFHLERLDTNDLPKQAGAAPVEWTRRAVGRDVEPGTMGTLRVPAEAAGFTVRPIANAGRPKPSSRSTRRRKSLH